MMRAPKIKTFLLSQGLFFHSQAFNPVSKIYPVKPGSDYPIQPVKR